MYTRGKMDKFGNIVDKGRGTLLKSEIDELNKLGFIWDASRGDWDNQFAKLQAYFKKNGHSYVLQAEDPSLYQWCYKYRKRENQITDEERKKFASVNFLFGFMKKDKTKKKALEKLLNPKNYTHDKRWNQMFEFLKSFKEKNGHFQVPKTTNDEKQLSLWVITQRVMRKKGKLSPERVDKLNSIEFPWKLGSGERRVKTKTGKVLSHSAQWMEQYKELLLYKTIHDNISVPSSNRNLYRWMDVQRKSFRDKLLSDERIKLLGKLGFNFKTNKEDSLGRIWNEKFEELKKYFEEQGTSTVPRNHSLYPFTASQRSRFRKKKLSQAQIDKLSSIKFNFLLTRHDGYDKIWMKRYADLIAFQKEYGHCSPSTKRKEFKSLGQWVLWQRMEKKKNIIKDFKVELLDKIGFGWKGESLKNNNRRKDEQWLKKYQMLIEYKKQYNNTNVPQFNKQLGRWVNDQRVHFNKGKLVKERVDKLNAIGFEWETKNAKSEELFNDRFNELIAFHKIYGNYKVPQNCKEFPKLGGWTAQIRHRGTTPERKKRLDDIGFNWQMIKRK